MRAPRVPRRPPAIPYRGGRFSRAFGYFVLALLGWRVRGELPDRGQLLVIAAPHSSAWDGIVGFAAAMALNIDFNWMGKDTLFKGLFGRFMHALGGIPTDRSNASGVVGSSIQALRANEAMWLVLAPEGTRRPVQRWRSGYYHIAKGAGVPILQIYLNYPTRTIGVGPLFHPTDNAERDMLAIEHYFHAWRGRRGSGK